MKSRYLLGLALATITFANPCPSTSRAEAPAQAQPAITAPTLSRDAKGIVSLADATPGLIIAYTLDGSDPDRSAGDYLAPIELAHGGTVKARAYSADRKQKSEVVTAKYEPIAGMEPLPSTIVPITQARNYASYDWSKRHAEVCAAVASEQPQVIFIGDSITHNFDKNIFKEAYGSYHAVNAGYGWDRTENALWRLQHGEIEGGSPKVAVVMIGTNNIGINTPADIATGVKAVCSEITKNQPKTKILLLAIFPRGQKPDDGRAKVTEVNKLISAFDGHDNINFLDIGKVFLNPDGTISKDIMGDFLHPSSKGYTLWVDAMKPTLSTLLGEEKSR